VKWLIFVILLLLPVATSAQEGRPNHLLGTQSPYLQQHLYNPVDWYPWGDEALTKAREEGKLIFVSVGYSSCHWCHVMREESFEDPEIAAFLNEHFISIKIDRERRPDLDEQFMLATQVLTGSGGWPNNVILTPLGDPVFGGTYFPPEGLSRLLTQMAELWQEEPALVNAEGFKLALYLKNYLTRTAAEIVLTPEILSGINQGLLDQMDVFKGGIGTAPKFPRESLFLYLLAQAQRGGDEALLEAVTAALDGMLSGGIHDHVGGGFHRYAVDPGWHVPHFEKMLYNQAMIGLLLVRSVKATGNPAHARALERLIDYVMRDMRDISGAFYAAQDADSVDMHGEKREGAFYVWTPEQIAMVSDQPEYLNILFQITENGELDGENVLHIPPGFDDFDKLDPLLEPLRAARAQRQVPATDQKILMGWNGMTLAMLAEASHLTGREDYWQAGAKAASYLLANMKTENGYVRVVFDGNAGVPAQLPDLGALALGLIALHDFAPQGEERGLWLEEAVEISSAIRTGFGSANEGYRMNTAMDGFSPVIALDDGEIPSGNALALMTFSRLLRRTELPDLAIDAGLLSAALSGHAAEIPQQRGASLAAIVELHEGETGPVRYASSGAVRVEVETDRANGQIKMNLSIKPGWHVNAHQPLEDYFIPTQLLVNDAPLSAATYPDAIVKSLGFNNDVLALYEGNLTLTAPLPDGPGTAHLTLQACSDEICLAPEELTFFLW